MEPRGTRGCGMPGRWNTGTQIQREFLRQTDILLLVELPVLCQSIAYVSYKSKKKNRKKNLAM